jgi:CDGSH-type Zn-finger protein/uncharacterized Fe-S cluster protein YjdI
MPTPTSDQPSDKPTEPKEEIRGQRVVIRFEGQKCIHSRNCVLARPDVFVPNAPGAWIHPDSALPEEIAALAQSCPSGAITYERLDGGKQEEAPLVNVIRVRENGPLAVQAELDIDGQPASFRATLCRCGASKNKPFCDGSHTAAAFTASGEPAAQQSNPLPTRNGKLKVMPRPNGPLIFTGSVEICTGTGHTITRTQKVALCRCGASNNKPFCDGTHARIGFSTEAAAPPAPAAPPAT